MRLDQNVQFRFTRLDGGSRQLQLAEGAVDLRILRGTGANAELDTPSIALRPRAAGSYRVSASTPTEPRRSPCAPAPPTS